jgi:cytochrome c biogenesis protein CcmG/thiol:disulfide interchange protein DsbE
MKKRYVLLPLAAFVVLTGFLAAGLRHDPHEIPSPLINKPAPAFNLPTLAAPEQRFGPADMKGKVWMLNVWASWCVSCREEHPVLLDFSRTHEVPLVGLDYKDTPAEARQWLSQFGDPYSLVAVDADGRVGIDYGVYGVPETYVIDQRGVIVHKHIGPISPEVLETEIRPLLKKLAS